MRLGKNEKEFLSYLDVTAGDVLLGFLTSSGSSYTINKRARQFARDRSVRKKQEHDRRTNQRKMVQRLEKKGLIQLVPQGKDTKIVLTSHADEYLIINRIKNNNKNYRGRWDGQWTVVSFDVPNGESSVRVRLAHLLQSIGFVQTQLSSYVYPYETQELFAFLRNNPRYGQYCQIIIGRYVCDDTQLRKMFDLQ